MAIFLKRRIEHNNDPIQPIQPNNLNNQQWNDYICSNFWLIFVIILAFIIGVGGRFVTVLIFNASSLPEEYQMQLKIQSIQLIQSVIFPLFMYVRDDKLVKHVKSEILG